MIVQKKSLLMLLLVAAYVFSACVSIFSPDRFLLRNPSTIILLIFSLSLMMYFSEHIIERSTRGYLVGVAGLITLWIVLRGAKYIAFEETESVARHIWYLYYIPALFIPLLSLFAALSVGEDRRPRAHRLARLAVLVTLVLAALVLTNDLHQLVFRFRPGFADWDSDYLHTPLFFLIYGWIALLFIGVICLLFSRCRVSASRRLVWVPMLPALFGIAYLTLSAVDGWPRVNGSLFGEFPEAVCFTMAGIWLSLMQIGLIPSNVGYGRLFNLSGLSAQIADRDYRIIYRSPTAVPLSVRARSSEADVSPDANTRIHRKQVHGGFVYWQDDITQLNRINEELREVGERLGEEAELLRLENRLKEQRAQIGMKTKAYDEIAEKVLAQSRKIAELCARAERCPDSYSGEMKRVCLLAAYIKRFANLSLLATEGSDIEMGELHLTLRESLRHVRDMGIPAEISCIGGGTFPAQSLLEGYELFERLLEQALPTLRGIQVFLREDGLKCVLEGAAPTLPEGCGAALTAEDGISYVLIPLRRAGEAACCP